MLWPVLYTAQMLLCTSQRVLGKRRWIHAETLVCLQTGIGY